MSAIEYANLELSVCGQIVHKFYIEVCFSKFQFALNDRMTRNYPTVIIFPRDHQSILVICLFSQLFNPAFRKTRNYSVDQRIIKIIILKNPLLKSRIKIPVPGIFQNSFLQRGAIVFDELTWQYDASPGRTPREILESLVQPPGQFGGKLRGGIVILLISL